MARRAAPTAPRREFLAWWIKCDPTSQRHGGWDWPDLFREYRRGEQYPWSVGPSLSQKNARLAQPGDPVFGYAAGEGHRELAALAQVERGAVFVAGEGPPRGASGFRGGFTVAISPVAMLDNPVPLAQVRAAMSGLSPEFLRTRFGSIFKVRPAEYRRLLAAVHRENPSLQLPRDWPKAAQGRNRGR